MGWIAAYVCAGCGTSSGHASRDGGTEASGYEDGPVTCGLTGDIPTCPSGKGLTCCFDLRTASGNCVAPGACTALIQFECANAAGCPAAEACCVEGLDAGDSLTATCQTSCLAGRLQACQADSECFGGACVPLPPGNVGGYAGIVMVCGLLDAGSPPSDGPAAGEDAASDAPGED